MSRYSPCCQCRHEINGLSRSLDTDTGYVRRPERPGYSKGPWSPRQPRPTTPPKRHPPDPVNTGHSVGPVCGTTSSMSVLSKGPGLGPRDTLVAFFCAARYPENGVVPGLGAKRTKQQSKSKIKTEQKKRHVPSATQVTTVPGYRVPGYPGTRVPGYELGWQLVGVLGNETRKTPPPVRVSGPRQRVHVVMAVLKQVAQVSKKRRETGNFDEKQTTGLCSCHKLCLRNPSHVEVHLYQTASV
eukprot:1521413-Rhodomonas_salina.2